MALPPVGLFPAAPGISLLRNKKLNDAVTAAISGISGGKSQPPAFSLTLVDLATGGASGSSLPMGGYKDDEEHYVASMAKIGVMYSAYALRDLVRRYAIAKKPATAQDLFTGVTADLNDAIARSSSIVLGGSATRNHRIPHYNDVFNVTALGASVEVRFRPEFIKALDKMIVPSDNTMAGRCVHGVGYSYLNAALEAGKMFDSSTKKGLWVAGDFSGGTDWPYVRIPSANDAEVAQASTSQAVALLMAIIMRDAALDATSCKEMRERLGRAARGDDPDGQGDESWLTRGDIPNHLDRAWVTHDKIGLGPLKAGGDVFSEVCVVSGVGGGTRSYVLAFQNFRPGTYRWQDLLSVIRGAIAAYEKP